MKITTQGQVTIPAHIRKSLSIKPGDSVSFTENEQGEIVLRKASQHQADPIETAASQFKLTMNADELLALLRDD